MTRKMRLSGDFDLSLIAKKTPGFVGADLASLTKEAAVIAINRIFTSLTQAEALAKTAHDDAPVSQSHSHKGGML
jgi:ribosome biogenesis ATPase